MTMRKTMILMSLLTLFSVSGQAQDNNEAQSESGAQGISNEITVEKADSAYIQGDFLTAISMYEHIIANDGVNATLYMNLGNAWFQQDEIAKAILNYERAYLLDPTDDDIRFNLELARTHTVDKVNPRSELFFNVWFRSVMNWLDVRQWTILTIILFALFVCCSAVLLFSGKRTVRKISLGFAAFFLCVSVLSYIFASTQKGNISHRDTAIIMEASVTVKSTPIESGTDLFTLHEGRKVEILDSSMKEWVEIRLEDGNTGWLPVSVMEII